MSLDSFFDLLLIAIDTFPMPFESMNEKIYVFLLTTSNVLDRPKPFHFAIVDEVDSVLIDEGRNPLLISGEVVS